MSSQHIRIVGTKASLEWNDMHPDELYYEVQGQPRQTLVRAMDYLNPEALEYERWVLCTTPADRVLEQPVYPFRYRNGCKEPRRRGDPQESGLPGSGARHRRHPLGNQVRRVR